MLNPLWKSALLKQSSFNEAGRSIVVIFGEIASIVDVVITVAKMKCDVGPLEGQLLLVFLWLPFVL